MLDYQPLIIRLSEVLGIPVEMVPAASYESVVDAVVSGGVDIALLGPASYLLAYQRNPRVEPFATLTLSQGQFTPAGHHYQALLITRPQRANTLEALRHKRVALSDPASTSGSLIPNVEFSAHVGMPLARFFSSVVYTGSHDKSLDALLEGRVDAAFVASVRVDTYINTGRASPESFIALWRSAPIYHDPYVFSGTLCPEHKALIRRFFLDDPRILMTFLISQNATGFASVSHAEYAPLLRMMQIKSKP